MTETRFVYQQFLHDLESLDGEDLVVILVGPGYVPDPAHELVTDLTDEIDDSGYARDTVAVSVDLADGKWRLLLDATPSFDTSNVAEVGGWVLATDGATDGDRRLVVFHEDAAGDTPANPYEIVCPDGAALVASDTLPAVTSVAGRTGDVALVLDDLTDVDVASPADGDVLTWDDGAGEWVPAAPAGGGGYEVGEWTTVGGVVYRVEAGAVLRIKVAEVAAFGTSATAGTIADTDHRPDATVGIGPVFASIDLDGTPSFGTCLLQVQDDGDVVLVQIPGGDTLTGRCSVDATGFTIPLVTP